MPRKAPEPEEPMDREMLEFLADISTEWEWELQRVRQAEQDAAREREQQEWVDSITEPDWSSRGARPIGDELREFVEDITGERDGCLEARPWDPEMHPRLGGPPNPGWWAPKGGGGWSSSSRPADPSDPSRWYLPAGNKGTWTGEKGQSLFKLHKPINVNGKLVHEIPYVGGVPVLDSFTLPGKTATIVLTGDHNIDRQNAKTAWSRLNPEKKIPTGATFHHDLLHATEHIVEVDGKQIKVLVGNMPLIPAAANSAVSHEGSRSLARKFYSAVGVDVGVVKKLAKEQAMLAGVAKTVVAEAAAKIKPRTIAKGLAGLVGRNVVRAIPLIGTGLAILEFADNVEAHGAAGAVLRSTPMLGELISAHDFGTDLAKSIVDSANQSADAELQVINSAVSPAWEKASQQAIATFHELAPHIRVTNEYGPTGLIDAHEVADAMRSYRTSMYTVNFLYAHGVSRKLTDDFAAVAKSSFKQRLIKAAQKKVPPRPRAGA